MTEIILANILSAIRANRNHKINLERMRRELDTLAEWFPPSPDTVYRPETSDIYGEWVFHPRQDLSCTILYLHGGGFIAGSARTHRGMGSRIAHSAAAKLFLVDYRLAPENRFPAAVEDTVSAYKWLLKKGIDPRTLVVAGDSAGGNLALSALVVLRNEGQPLPAAAVLISPWLDLEVRGQSIRQNAKRDPILGSDRLRETAAAYLGDSDRRHSLASPLYADMTGLPPLMIHVSNTEILLDDSKRLAKKASKAGVKVDLQICEDMVHAWPFFAPVLPEGQKTIGIIGQFVREHIYPFCLNGPR